MTPLREKDSCLLLLLSRLLWTLKDLFLKPLSRQISLKKCSAKPQFTFRFTGRSRAWRTAAGRFQQKFRTEAVSETPARSPTPSRSCRPPDWVGWVKFEFR